MAPGGRSTSALHAVPLVALQPQQRCASRVLSACRALCPLGLRAAAAVSWVLSPLPLLLPLLPAGTKHEVGPAAHPVPANGSDPTADPNYCGSCYGAQTREGQCCNTCAQVRRGAGWGGGGPHVLAHGGGIRAVPDVASH